MAQVVEIVVRLHNLANNLMKLRNNFRAAASDVEEIDNEKNGIDVEAAGVSKG